MSLCEKIAAGLRDGAGIEKSEAERLAAKVIEWGEKHGISGERHYWPAKARPLSAEERDQAIRAEYRPGNLVEICEKYSVSRAAVYRALKR